LYKTKTSGVIFGGELSIEV